VTRVNDGAQGVYGGDFTATAIGVRHNFLIVSTLGCLMNHCRLRAVSWVLVSQLCSDYVSQPGPGQPLIFARRRTRFAAHRKRRTVL
jgi:hypothetical protein